MKKRPLFLLLLLCYSFWGLSQNVSGVVYLDTDDEVAAGATVRVKGTNIGVITDLNGRYTIQASQEDILVASYVGYATQEKPVTGATTDFYLQSSSTLDGVVVTALGIEKEDRALGYSVQEVDASTINLAGQANSLQALQGKVSGVQISQASGASGGGVDILIRGITSMNPTRDNQPLIVIDGVVVSNETFSGNVLPSAGSNSPSSNEQFSFANRAIDINPEDVESYSILKGAAATALYGIRASNGAIVITTKKGKKGKPKVNVTASTSFRDLVTTPERQTIYREGWATLPRTLYEPNSETGFNRVQVATSFYSWGPKYTDDSATLPDGTVVDLSNDKYYDPYDLFVTGRNNQVNASVSGANDFVDYFLSFGRNTDQGILSGTEYNKSNLRLNTGFQLLDNLKLNTSISFNDSDGDQAPAGDKSVMSALSYYSGTFDINDYQNVDGSQRDYSFGIIDNPRYLQQYSSLTNEVKRWIGNAQIMWEPIKDVSLNYAIQMDNYDDARNRFVPPNVDLGAAVGGFITEQDINFKGVESNFYARHSRTLSDKVKANIMVGHQLAKRERNYLEIRGERLNVPGVNQIANTINPFNTESLVRLRDMGIFGEVGFEFDNALYVTLTGRNDWLSTLPKENRSFFYPSVSLAYDVTTLFPEVNNFDFGKIRASWAQVGKGPGFGQIGSFYIADGDFPFGGTGGYRADVSIGDPDIIPETNKSFEIGGDFRFLENRLRLDYAYYTNRVEDQIFPVRTAYSSGIASYVRNAGDFKTWGHELLLIYDMLSNSDFNWTTALNWSTNKGEVLDLPDDVESIIFADSGFAGVTSEVREGDRMGTLYGWRWTYNDAGQRLISDDGFPRIDFSERQIAGNAFPDFISSLDNTFEYKGFTLNALLEWKKGGDMYDAGYRNGIRNGIWKTTEFRNEETVLEGVLADGSPNNIPVYIDAGYYRNSVVYNRASEILVQDASWWKFRNLSLGYDFGKLIQLDKIDRLNATVSATNLMLHTNYDGYDPEGNQYSAGSNVYGFTGLNLPLPRTYSFGLNVGF